MASASQRLIIIKNKNPKKPGSYILISKKTGFKDVTINGKRYYYNIHQKYEKSKDIKFENIVKENIKIRSKPKIVVRRTQAEYEPI